ncbi:DMT family transporter [candidate division KSB1 bacterium]|nr:DMT family transporter [candidate division KSB1 bacterium]
MNLTTVRKELVLGLGMIAISGAAILIKLCAAPPLVIAAYRLTLAALFYGTWVGLRTSSIRSTAAGLPWAALVTSGLFLSVHFAAWISSLSMTSVSSSVVLVQLSPIFVAFGGFVLLGEGLTRRQILGVSLAVLGGMSIGLHDFYRQQSTLAGNILAVVGAVGASGYFIAGRFCRKKMDTVLYVAIVYAIAAGAVLIALAAMRLPLFGYSTDTLFLLLAIAIGPQIIGHTSLNWALKHYSATAVAVITLTEPIGASLLAVFLLNESLSLEKIGGAVLILSGLGLVLISKARE